MTHRIPALAVLAAALLAGPAVAQSTIGHAGTDGHAGVPYDLGQADQLRAQALALHDQPDRWKQVAWLHERSARLRTPDDPVLLEDLQVAASLAARHGDYRRGARLMEDAAGAALVVGDVVRAADAYIVAAIMANRDGHGEHALALIERAQLLSRSPLLSQAQCDCIRSRIIEVPVAVASH